MLIVETPSTYFSSNRSCILDPVSEAFPCTPLKLSFKFLPCCNSLSRFLSGLEGNGSDSSDRSSLISKEMTGMGSSRLTKASTVNSSILCQMRVCEYDSGGLESSSTGCVGTRPVKATFVALSARQILHPLPCSKRTSNTAKESD
jgi:hypothetical protein